MNKFHRPSSTAKILPLLPLFPIFLLGLLLRFANLGLKSASSIELATLGFSLGHGFTEVPLDSWISLETLLLPLRFDPNTSLQDVFHHLMTESTHPPLYFFLTHWWLHLFGGKGGWEALIITRFLSAILGAISIPSIYFLANLAFRSPLVGYLAAALMAVSPYGIYLSQEARHYTLTILWIIISLGCLLLAMRSLQEEKNLSLGKIFVWVLVNGLGVASHYFFIITLAAEALVIVFFWLKAVIAKKFLSSCWWRIYIAISITAIFCSIWFQALQSIGNNDLTEWIETSFAIDRLWLPFPRLLGWWITMVLLLPVEKVGLLITILSVTIVLGVLIWTLPSAIVAWKINLNNSLTRLSSQVFGLFLLNAIALFIFIIYILRKDVSLAARYHFVYFPALLVVLSSAIAICWENSAIIKTFTFAAKGKQVGIILLLMGLLGSLTVISNYGYQKSRRSDLFVAHFHNNSQVPAILVTNYQVHSQLRELMIIGLDMQKQKVGLEAQFFLQKEGNFINNFNSRSRPFDLWLVNIESDRDRLEKLNCLLENYRPKITGYRYRQYHCR